MRIGKYIVRRLLFFVPVLFGVTLITFGITRVVPGNPVNLMVHAMVDQELIDKLIRQYGFDLPWHEQYIRYLGDLLRGDFGISFRTCSYVLDEITGRFPATL